MHLQWANVPAGRFRMGNNEDIACRAPEFLVRISKRFSMLSAPVTQETWVGLMNSRPWGNAEEVLTGFKEGNDFPATAMTHAEASEFCRRLTTHLGSKCRLPSDAEWEYSIRAGSQTTYFWGESRDVAHEFAVISDLDAKRALGPVMTRKPNAFGLYDMAGLVREWVLDKCDTEDMNISKDHYPTNETSDFVHIDGTVGIVRNGHWRARIGNCSSSYKLLRPLDDRMQDVGFRVLMEQ